MGGLLNLVLTKGKGGWVGGWICKNNSAYIIAAKEATTEKKKKTSRTFSKPKKSMLHGEKSYQAYTRLLVHEKGYKILVYTKSLATPLQSQMVYPQ